MVPSRAFKFCQKASGVSRIVYLVLLINRLRKLRDDMVQLVLVLALQMDSLWIRWFQLEVGRQRLHAHACMRPKLHLSVFGHAFRVTGVLA
jgi:hypothetical protein